MLRFTFILISFFISFLLHGQSISSLFNSYKDSVNTNLELPEKLLDNVHQVTLYSALDTAYYKFLKGMYLCNIDSTTIAIKELDNSLKYAKSNEELIYKTVILINSLYNSSGNYDLACEYAIETLRLKTIEKDLYKSNLNRAAGNSYIEAGKFSESIKYYSKAATLDSISGDTSKLINSLYNIGICYYYLSNYEISLNYYHKALNLSKLANQEKNIAICLNNIGGIYEKQHKFDKAIDYYKNSLAYFQAVNYELGYSRALANIGNIYKQNGNFNEALLYLNKALKINHKASNKVATSKNYNDIGGVYHSMKKYYLAIENFEKALDLCKTHNYIYGEAINYHNLGKSYYELNKYIKSSIYLKKSNELLKTIGDKNLELLNYELLANLYKAKHNYIQAYEALQKHHEIYKIVFDDNAEQKIIELETKYELSKKNELIKYQNNQISLKNEIIIRDNKLKNMFFILLISLGIIIIVISWTLRNKRKSNLKISQKNELLEKQKSLLNNSIYYAKRIQGVMQTSREILNTIFKNNYLLYRPKDIVSGDFIWAKKIEDTTILAVADCTGHGVPGGFMSMLGISFLNEQINLDKSTGEILNDMRRFVKTSLKQNGNLGEPKDGINISLIKWNNTTNRIELSSAYQPIILIRDNKLSIIKGDKQPVGIHYNESNFNVHEMQLLSGDELIFYSDGYIDQFNQENKRISTKRFTELLLKLNKLSASEKENKLNEFYENWRKNIEQIDDVLVFGFQI